MLYVMVDTFGAAMLCILTAFRLLVNCYWSALHHTCMLGYVISGYYFFFLLKPNLDANSRFLMLKV